MNIKTIQIDNYQWTSNKVIEDIVSKNLEDYFYSWGVFSTPTSYTKCNGNNIAIRKCTIDSQLFIECDFRGIDASDSTFIDCLFLNCQFKNANFHKANFIGTAIIQDKNCQNERFGAGVSQTQFNSSQLNHSVLSNLKLDGCSFRYSVFENTIFNQVSIEYTSFEDAYFNNCTLDSLDLRSSACRGIIIIDNCKIKKYVSSPEKTLGGIGTLQILKYGDDVELYKGSNKIKSNELEKELEKVSYGFLLKGKLFEFINIMNYLYEARTQKHVNNYILPSRSALQPFIQNNSVNGYLVSEKGKLLYQIIDSAYETIINSDNKIDLDDILYSLKLMFFLNINEYILLRLLLDIYKNEMLTRQNNYSDFLVLSQIKYYFQAIGNQIKSNIYRITFHNETASWLDRDSRNDFYEFCKQFIITAGEDNVDFKLVSMHEGSIDAIFESLFNIENILIVASILGCRFEIKEGKISFLLNPAEGIKTYGEFIKQIASIIPLLGDKKICKIRSKPSHSHRYFLPVKMHTF